VVTSHNVILLASGDFKRQIYGTVTIEYLSSGTRVPDKQPDRVPW